VEGGKLCGTGLYRLGGLIVWNWTVYVWGANCMDLESIGMGGILFGTGSYSLWVQIILNCTV
jgi:hypothetical protein